MRRINYAVVNRTNRPRLGQALVEGVVALVLIVAVTVAAISLLVNVALIMYNKQQLGAICNQVASFASLTVNRYDPKDLLPVARSLAEGTPLTIPNDGIELTEFSVKLSNEVTLPGIRVNMKAQAPLLFGSFGPSTTINSTGSSMAALSQVNTYNTVIEFPDMGNHVGYYVPAWHVPDGARFSDWNFPLAFNRRTGCCKQVAVPPGANAGGLSPLSPQIHPGPAYYNSPY